MSISKTIRNSLFIFTTVAITHYVAHAQTGNTGGSSGGTGGGQHGEGSGPGFNSPGFDATSYTGDPDANPYATATPHDITEGVAPPPEGTPRHGKGKKDKGSDKGSGTNPSR